MQLNCKCSIQRTQVWEMLIQTEGLTLERRPGTAHRGEPASLGLLAIGSSVYP